MVGLLPIARGLHLGLRNQFGVQIPCDVLSLDRAASAFSGRTSLSGEDAVFGYGFELDHVAAGIPDQHDGLLGNAALVDDLGRLPEKANGNSADEVFAMDGFSLGTADLPTAA